MFAPQNTPQQAVHNTFNFSDENVTKLDLAMQRQSIPAGTALFWEGELADKLYYIYEGRVKLSKCNNEGKDFTLYIFQQGDFIGELDPFQDSKQSFHAIALEDCTYGFIQKEDLIHLIWQHGDFAIQFTQWLGLMHRLTQTKFRDLLLYGKSGALSSTLIRLANSYGQANGNGILLSKRVTNTELADYIGATRESVNRMLSDLKKLGAIDYDHGHIVIKEMDRLRAICHCEDCPKEICRI